jgi:hydroxymethylpyrimidine pyrophosphatase-like HAD family hydrolase
MIFNKGAVMILPTGLNKATGLREGLSRMGLSTRYTIGVGDAENDHAFLRICGCGVAVANALPALKSRADFVTARPHGEGITELIDQLLANNFQPGPGYAAGEGPKQ